MLTDQAEPGPGANGTLPRVSATSAINTLSTPGNGRDSRLCHTDDADGDATAGIADRLTIIIGLLVDDETPAEDRVRTAERQVGIDEINRGVAILVRLDVAQVPNVPFRGFPLAVLLGRGVEVSPSRLAIRRPDAEFVYVKAMLARRQAGGSLP